MADRWPLMKTSRKLCKIVQNCQNERSHPLYSLNVNKDSQSLPIVKVTIRYSIGIKINKGRSLIKIQMRERRLVNMDKFNAQSI